MANIARVKIFSSLINESVPAFAKRMHDWAQARSITILDVAGSRSAVVAKTRTARAVISYRQPDPVAAPSSGLRYLVLPYITTRADTQVISSEKNITVGLGSRTTLIPYTGLAAGMVVQHIIDVSDLAPQEGVGSSYIAFVVNQAVNAYAFGHERLGFFANPTTLILPGSTGTARAISSFNDTARASVPVKNVSNYAWSPGEVNYIVPCPLTGRYIACGPNLAPLPVPTSPAFRARSFPRMGGVSETDVKQMTYPFRALPYTPVKTP